MTRHPRAAVFRGSAVLAACAVLALAGGCAKKVAPPAGEPALEVSDGKRVLEHTVGRGETLALIADNYYGDPDRRSPTPPNQAQAPARA